MHFADHAVFVFALGSALNKLNKTFCPGEFQLIYQKSPSKHHSYSYSNSYCYSRVIFQFLIKTLFPKLRPFQSAFITQTDLAADISGFPQ